MAPPVNLAALGKGDTRARGWTFPGPGLDASAASSRLRPASRDDKPKPLVCRDCGGIARESKEGWFLAGGEGRGGLAVESWRHMGERIVLLCAATLLKGCWDRHKRLRASSESQHGGCKARSLLIRTKNTTTCMSSRRENVDTSSTPSDYCGGNKDAQVTECTLDRVTLRRLKHTRHNAERHHLRA